MTIIITKICIHTYKLVFSLNTVFHLYFIKEFNQGDYLTKLLQLDECQLPELQITEGSAQYRGNGCVMKKDMFHSVPHLFADIYTVFNSTASTSILEWSPIQVLTSNHGPSCKVKS